MPSLLAGAALVAVAAHPAAAQFAGALGVRSVSGEEPIAANSDRRGYEFRLLWDGALSGALGWRAELTGVQMQFQRNDGARNVPVSENGVELSVAARPQLRSGALAGLYAVLGPSYSIRAVCGTSGLYSSTGRVACDEGRTQQLGYQAGLGYATPVTPRRELLFEVRLVDRVIAGAGNPVVVIGFGLRARRDQRLNP